MGDRVQDDTEYVRVKTQWRAGIAALRRVRNHVDGYEREEQFKKAAAKYVTASLIFALILALLTVVFFPGAIQNLFRSMS